jgi:membrane protease subunit HflK
LFGAGARADGRSRDFAIRTVAESVLTALLAEMPIDDVLASGKTKLQLDAAERVREMCDELHLGVGIRGVNIVDVNPPASVVSAFNDVQSARADRERSISEAAGYSAGVLPKARAQADRLVREAEGSRAETVESARGIADSFTKLSEEVAKHPELGRRRLWNETAKLILARGRKIVVPPSTSGSKQTVFIGR